MGGRRFLGFDVRNSVFYKFFYISLEGKHATDLYTMGSLISTVKHDYLATFIFIGEFSWFIILSLRLKMNDSGKTSARPSTYIS